MRTVGWLLVFLLNGAVGVVFSQSIFEVGAPSSTKVFGALVGTLCLAVILLLVQRRLARSPAWARPAMRCLCFCFPALWLLGSLDHGILSGLEIWSVLLVGLLSWGTWRAFNLFPPEA